MSRITFDYKDGFVYNGNNPWETEEWMLGKVEGESDNIKRYYGYDANLVSSGNFSTRPKTDLWYKIIELALKHTSDWKGDVYLVDFLIKKDGIPLFTFDNKEKKPTEPESKTQEKVNEHYCFCKMEIDNKVHTFTCKKTNNEINADVFKGVLRTLLYQWLHSRIGLQRKFVGNIVNSNHFSKIWDFSVGNTCGNSFDITSDKLYDVPLDQALREIDYLMETKYDFKNEIN